MFRNYQDTVRTPKKTEETYPELTKAYSCNLCDKGGWLTPNDVEIHKKNAHVKIIHEYKAKHKDRFCTVCMTLLDSYDEHIRHLKSKHLLSSPNAQRVERVIYICDECSNIFFNKDVLIAHMMSVHLTKKSNRMNKRIECPKCFETLRLHTIWFHLQKHEIPSVSLCDICLTNFPNQTVLSEHMQSHKRYLKCESCGYSSNKFLQYESHIEQHEQKRVPSNRDVSEHVLNTVFKKRKNYFVRYNMHNAIKGLNLPTRFMQICTLCREICVTQEDKRKHVLRDHIMVDEAEKKKHLCVCGKEFEYKVVLKQHVLKMKGTHQAADITKTPSIASERSDIKMDTSNVTERREDLDITKKTPSIASERSDIKMDTSNVSDRREDLDANLQDSRAEIIKLTMTEEVRKMDTIRIEFTNLGADATDVTFATLSPVHQGKSENN